MQTGLWLHYCCVFSIPLGVGVGLLWLTAANIARHSSRYWLRVHIAMNAHSSTRDQREGSLRRLHRAVLNALRASAMYPEAPYLLPLICKSVGFRVSLGFRV